MSFCDPATGRPCWALNESQYVVIMMKVSRVLLGGGWEYYSAERAAKQDWKHDSRGHGELEREAFMDAVFTIADLWTDSVEADGYAWFLRKLRTRCGMLGQPIKRPPKSRRKQQRRAARQAPTISLHQKRKGDGTRAADASLLGPSLEAEPSAAAPAMPRAANAKTGALDQRVRAAEFTEAEEIEGEEDGPVNDDDDEEEDEESSSEESEVDREDAEASTTGRLRLPQIPRRRRRRTRRRRVDDRWLKEYAAPSHAGSAVGSGSEDDGDDWWTSGESDEYESDDSYDVSRPNSERSTRAKGASRKLESRGAHAADEQGDQRPSTANKGGVGKEADGAGDERQLPMASERDDAASPGVPGELPNDESEQVEEEELSSSGGPRRHGRQSYVALSTGDRWELGRNLAGIGRADGSVLALGSTGFAARLAENRVAAAKLHAEQHEAHSMEAAQVRAPSAEHAPAELMGVNEPDEAEAQREPLVHDDAATLDLLFDDDATAAAQEMAADRAEEADAAHAYIGNSRRSQRPSGQLEHTQMGANLDQQAEGGACSADTMQGRAAVSHASLDAASQAGPENGRASPLSPVGSCAVITPGDAEAAPPLLNRARRTAADSPLKKSGLAKRMSNLNTQEQDESSGTSGTKGRSGKGRSASMPGPQPDSSALQRPVTDLTDRSERAFKERPSVGRVESTPAATSNAERTLDGEAVAPSTKGSGKNTRSRLSFASPNDEPVPPSATKDVWESRPTELTRARPTTRAEGVASEKAPPLQTPDRPPDSSAEDAGASDPGGSRQTKPSPGRPMRAKRKSRLEVSMGDKSDTLGFFMRRDSFQAETTTTASPFTASEMAPLPPPTSRSPTPPPSAHDVSTALSPYGRMPTPGSRPCALPPPSATANVCNTKPARMSQAARKRTNAAPQTPPGDAVDVGHRLPHMQHSRAVADDVTLAPLHGVDAYIDGGGRLVHGKPYHLPTQRALLPQPPPLHSSFTYVDPDVTAEATRTQTASPHLPAPRLLSPSQRGAGDDHALYRNARAAGGSYHKRPIISHCQPCPPQSVSDKGGANSNALIAALTHKTREPSAPSNTTWSCEGSAHTLGRLLPCDSECGCHASTFEGTPPVAACVPESTAGILGSCEAADDVSHDACHNVSCARLSHLVEQRGWQTSSKQRRQKPAIAALSLSPRGWSTLCPFEELMTPSGVPMPVRTGGSLHQFISAIQKGAKNTIAPSGSWQIVPRHFLRDA